MIRAIACILMALLTTLAPMQEKPKPSEGAKPVALTQEDLQKLQTAYTGVEKAHLDLERAKARYDQTVTEFNRVKAVIIGDHNLAPSKHDLSSDFKFIIAMPEQKK